MEEKDVQPSAPAVARPILKSIRHKYLGLGKFGPATVTHRPLPQSYSLKWLTVPGDRKQFYANSSKGQDQVLDNARTRLLLRREKIRKPIVTTGESDAKIRMPPPRLPPPRFVKKKRGGSKAGAKLRPTLQPVDGSHSLNKNKLKFVPFELQHGRSRTLSPTFPTKPGKGSDKRSGSSKAHGKGKGNKPLTLKRSRDKIVKKLRPIEIPDDATDIPANHVRKLMNSWAKKLGSLAKAESFNKNSNAKKAVPVVKSTPTLPHPTKAQLKQTDLPKPTVQKCGFPIRNRYKLGKFKSFRATYYSAKEDITVTGDSDTTSLTPLKVAIPANPLVNHTIELLRYKRDLESCNVDRDTISERVAAFPEMPENVPKGELLVENIPISTEEAKSVLMKRVSVLLAHGGFTHTKLPALEMLSDCLNKFLLRISRRLKQIKERELAGVDHGFPDPVERALVELGMGGVRGLEEFYKTKVVDYHRRMLERCNYLKNHYTNMLQAKTQPEPQKEPTSGPSMAPQTSSSLVDIITASVQSSEMDSALKTDDALSQCNLLRLNFEEPNVPTPQLNDTTVNAT